MAERILLGDALERLRELPPESVHTCVTSPPYYKRCTPSIKKAPAKSRGKRKSSGIHYQTSKREIRAS